MYGLVLSVSLNKERGFIKYQEKEITLIENYGVVGDGHAGDVIKQVSLVGLESYKKMELEDSQKHQFGAFAENITTEGIVLYNLKIGNTLIIGDVILEVSQIGKKIHPTNFKTMLPKEGIFAIVIKGGIIKKGDLIEVIE